MISNPEHVYKSIQNGVAIGASDGSVVTIDNEAYGGHSYSIQAWDTDKQRICGEAPTPHSTNISSLTTELYGLLASTLLVYILGKKYDTDQNFNASTTITADNKQAIQMGNEWNTPLNISETNTHEYDLWTLLYQLKTAAPLNLSYKWIKGHQDQLKTGEKIYGPFTRPVQLNIQMDNLAKELLNNHLVCQSIDMCTLQLLWDYIPHMMCILEIFMSTFNML